MIIPIQKFTSYFISNSRLRKLNIRHVIGVPIRYLDALIGLLCIYTHEANSQSLLQQKIVESITDEMNTTLPNTGYYNSASTILNGLESIRRIARDSKTFIARRDLFNDIINTALSITDSQHALILYREFAGLEWNVSFGASPDKISIESIIEPMTIPNLVMHEQKIVVHPSSEYHDKINLLFDYSLSALGVPVFIGEQLVAVLYLESARLDSYSDLFVRLISLLAEEIANIVNNRHLVSLAERKTQEVILLREIGEALARRKSIDEIFELIAQQSLNIVGQGNKVVFVLLHDTAKDILEIKSFCGEQLSNTFPGMNLQLSQNSIIVWVFKNRRVRLVPDVAKDGYYFPIHPDIQSEVAVPLIFGNQVIGVIDIESTKRDAFSEQDIELLQTLADNTASAIKISELVNIHLKQLEVLYRTGTTFSANQSLNDVLRAVAREALHAIGSQNRILKVLLIDKKNHQVVVQMAAGDQDDQELLGRRFSSKEGICGWVIQTKKYYLCSDVQRDPYYCQLFSTTRSELCVPIIYDNLVIGLIDIESALVNDFNTYDIQLLDLLARQAGVSISNARLNEGLAETQYQLTQAQEAAVIGETFAGLSHDIRTCSSLISGEAQWVQQLYDERTLTLEDSYQAMSKIESYIERIERLTDDLTKRSKQSLPDFELADVAALIRECVFLMSSRAKRQNILIYQYCPSDISWTYVDKSRLKRVFINIISNAIEAMPNGGKLSVLCQREKEYLAIRFVDTGIGIPEDKLRQVGKSFFTTKDKGIGLGLAICRKIIEDDHKGELRISSIVGRGTTIELLLITVD
ncbi:GAF domain-containing protein [candidate division KSB1 bacterium]|nr:GAF domain-containing protein [candidate division KSB1 bacterium]